jgi:mannose-1-phosphate guanylyltransferase
MFDAFVLAAGHGTRLRPLTERLPKPLVPVCGAPMLDYALALCRAHGMRRVVVNAHHLAPAIVAWAAARPDVEVSVEAPEILGTGGGLRAVADRLGPRVAVVNGDTLCDVDLRALVGAVPTGGAALALRCHPLEAAERYGIVAFDADGAVVDLKGMARAEPRGPVRRDSHFTGIHALDRAVLDRLPPGASCIVRQGYLGVVPDRRIRAIVHGGTWLDVGDPAAYLDANLAVLDGAVRLPLDPWVAAGWSGSGAAPGGGRASGRCWVGRDAQVRGSVSRSAVGVGAVVPKGAELADCVVWDGVEVPEGRWSRVVFAGAEPVEVDRAARTVLVAG